MRALSRSGLLFRAGKARRGYVRAFSSASGQYITDQDRLDYKKNGFLIKERFLSSDSLARFHQVCDDLMARSEADEASQSDWNRGGFVLSTGDDGKPIPGRLLKVQGVCAEVPETLALPRHPQLVAAASTLLDDCGDLDVFGTKFFPMLPGGTTVNWHQDNHFFGTDSSDIVTAALYLEDSSEENGCLRIVPGSHIASEVLPHTPGTGEWAQGEWVQMDGIEETAIDVECPAGTCVFFSTMLLHGAHKNRSTTRTRRSFFWHYTRAEAQFAWRGVDFTRGVYNDRHVVMEGGVPVELDV